MKIKLLVIISAIGLPMSISAQKSSVYLYNTGVMSVSGTDPSQATLYINGNFVSGGKNGDAVHCDITLNNSKTILTGDFIHNDLSDNATVFNANSTSTAVFEFNGTDVQYIKSDGSSYSEIPNKETSYINFPILNINNDLSYASSDKTIGAVLVDPTMALAAKTINLNNGWLVLQSTLIDDTNATTFYATKGDFDVLGGRRTALAHLMLDKTTGKVNYNNWNATNAYNRGVIEVDLNLRTDDEAANTTNVGRKLTGLGSPFERLYGDYFMWNFLLAPTNESIFSQTFSNPTDYLTPGRGYILGIDLRGSNYDSYSWDIEYPNLNAQKFTGRATKGYAFNRTKFASLANTNNIYGTTANIDAYQQEILNGQKDIVVTLKKGYNYISNPYTAPLNVTPIINATGTTVTGWNVISGPASSTNRQIRNRVWVLNNNSSTGMGSSLASKKITVDLKYYLAKQVGGTYAADQEYLDGDYNDNRVIIPPLQMFLVYSEVDNVDMTIPRSAQQMGNATFLRSANTSTETLAADDFLFEVVDKATGASDRTSVILRTKAEVVKNSDFTSDLKIKSQSELDNSETIPTKDEDGLNSGFSSLVYTKSNDGKILTSNFITYENYQTKVTTTLFVKPSNKEQDIVLKGLRLNSLKEFEEVILVDNLTGKKQVLTADNNEYATSTKPTDSADRFTLIFNRSTTGIDENDIENNSKKISSYYANGVLTVTGFDEIDFGSKLSVYDIQGRLIKQVSVNDFTVNVNHPFIPGAYIVKVVGNNSYVAKFLVK